MRLGRVARRAEPPDRLAGADPLARRDPRAARDEMGVDRIFAIAVVEDHSVAHQPRLAGRDIGRLPLGDARIISAERLAGARSIGGASLAPVTSRATMPSAAATTSAS